MSRIVATGYATPEGLLLRCGDGLRKVEPTRTPLVDLVPCRHCGELVCDCQDWLEWMLLAEPLPQECIGDVA